MAVVQVYNHMYYLILHFPLKYYLKSIIQKLHNILPAGVTSHGGVKCLLVSFTTCVQARAALQAGPFSDSCVHAAYDDQVHGFLTARGEWSDPKVAAAATEALALIIKFLRTNLSA
jgi:hypothetical protein